MRRFAVVFLMLLGLAGTSFAKIHKAPYSIPCSTLWPAVKDTLNNSGEYSIVRLDNTEMAASFAVSMGGRLRINAVLLNPKGDACEMQLTVQSIAFSDDANDFEKRVGASLAERSAPPAKSENPSK